MIYVGLDPSLASFGWCTSPLPGRGVRSGVLTSEEDGIWRPIDLARQVVSLLEEPRLQVRICIEGYSYGSRHQAHQLGELGGILRHFLLNEAAPAGYPVTYCDVPPMLLKRFAAGKANVKKDEMRLAAYKRWGVELPTEHEIDAYCLMQMARLKWDPDGYEGATADQKAAVAKLT